MQHIDIEQIVFRLKRYLNADSVKVVSAWLGLDEDFIADKKRKKYGPAEIVAAIVDKCIEKDVDISFILTGKKEKEIKPGKGGVLMDEDRYDREIELISESVQAKTEAKIYKELFDNGSNDFAQQIEKSLKEISDQNEKNLKEIISQSEKTFAELKQQSEKNILEIKEQNEKNMKIITSYQEKILASVDRMARIAKTKGDCVRMIQKTHENHEIREGKLVNSK